MKRVISNWGNYSHVIGLSDDMETPVYASNSQTEVFTKPSLTVPNMSISLATLLKRSRTGGTVTTFEGVFAGEDDLLPVNFEKMDKMEKEQYLRDVAASSRASQDVLAQRNAERKSKADKAAFDAAVSNAAKRVKDDPNALVM